VVFNHSQSAVRYYRYRRPDNILFEVNRDHNTTHECRRVVTRDQRTTHYPLIVPRISDRLNSESDDATLKASRCDESRKCYFTTTTEIESNFLSTYAPQL